MLLPLNLFKYGIVGISGIFIDFGITWFLKEKIRSNKYLANASGFSVAVISNFLLNKYWTFQNHSPNQGWQFLLFLLIAVVGLLLNFILIKFIHGKKKVPFYTAKILAIGIVFCWNYCANTLITFR